MSVEFHMTLRSNVGRKRNIREIQTLTKNKRRRLNIFNIGNVVKTNEFKNIKNVMNQEQYYKLNGSSENILKIVRLSNKAFGEKIQCIIQELLSLTKSSHTGHDAQLESNNLKFEIKSSRYGVRNNDFTWQHIMEQHNYDHLILVGIDFFSLRVFIISKTQFMKLTDNLVKVQGGAEGQGKWCTFRKIEEYLYEIKNKDDLYNYLNI